MDEAAMSPFGRALAAYLEGDAAAALRLRRDDGLVAELLVRHFFRDPSEFSEIERTALAECRGRVLDVGAGTGLHSLWLQEQGFEVTAIDVSIDAVAVMRRRGVRDARHVDVLAFEGDAYDTLLMLGHGLGMAGDLDGLDRFLDHARDLLRPGGRLLVDSLDVTRTDLPEHLAYHDRNREAGRYVGETRLRNEHAGLEGAPYRWLHVDARTLAERAKGRGWRCETLVQLDSGDHLARLALAGATDNV